MPAAVVDSSVLVDFRDENSDRYDRARRIIGDIDAGVLPTGHVTNYIALETLNWLHTRMRPDLAVDTQERLSESAGFELVHSAQKDFTRAVEIHEQFDGLSFGDATIAAYMERTDLQYLYSFDDDFDAVEWVTRLETVDDPFEP